MLTAESRLLVLHSIRLGGLVELERIAGATGLRPEDVEAELAGAAAQGLVRRREGRVAGWLVTSEGRTAARELVASELERSGSTAELTARYRAFLTINAELLATCTAWQVRDEQAQILNDHSDAAYDRGVIERLVTVDDQVQPICAGLAGLLERFSRYGSRLSNARSRIEAGEVEHFTSPRIASYHTVWFELHEDLLCTLGLERSSEGDSA